MKCSNCDKEYPSGFYFSTPSICTECFDKLPPEQQAALQEESRDFKREREEGKPYPVLRTIAVIYKILAVLSVIGGFIGFVVGIVLFASGDFDKAWAVAAISIFYGTMGLISSLAISEGIGLLLEVENNSRINRKLITSLLNNLKKA